MDDLFDQLAPHVFLYHLRANWLAVSKLFNDLAKEYDVSMAMAFVILAISDNGTPVTKIAPRLGMEPNSLSRLLNSLQNKGVIYRENDIDDQRKVLVFLTDYGKKLRTIAIQTVVKVETKITNMMTPEERKLLMKIMRNVGTTIKSLRDNIDKLKEERETIKMVPSEIISQILIP